MKIIWAKLSYNENSTGKLVIVKVEWASLSKKTEKYLIAFDIHVNLKKFSFWKKRQKVLKFIQLDIHINFPKWSKALKHCLNQLNAKLTQKVDLSNGTLLVFVHDHYEKFNQTKMEIQSKRIPVNMKDIWYYLKYTKY